MERIRIPWSTLPRLLPISRETGRRWRRRRQIPPVAMIALRLKHDGDLGEISENFRGWRIRNGIMWSPTGARWSVQDLEAWHYERQLLAAYRRRLHPPE